MSVNKNTFASKTTFELDVQYLIEALYPRLHGDYIPIKLEFNCCGFAVNNEKIEGFAQKDVLTSPLMRDAFKEWQSNVPIPESDKDTLETLINDLSDKGKDFQKSRDAFMDWAFSPSLYLQDRFWDILLKMFLPEVCPLPGYKLALSSHGVKSSDSDRVKLFAFYVKNEVDAPIEPPSLLREALEELFRKWERLTRLDSRFLMVADMDTETLIRHAAENIMNRCCCASYQLCHELSAARYESSICRGAVVFSQEPLGKQLSASFMPPIPFHLKKLRFIRKLLAMTEEPGADDYALCTRIRKDGAMVVGLVPRSLCDKNYSVEFKGLMRWTLRHCGKEVFSYKEGSFGYYDEMETSFDEEYKKLSQFLYRQNSGQRIDVVRRIVETLWKQRHGAMLILFSDNQKALEEMKRLSAAERGIQLEEPVSFKNNEQLLLSLSGVDGAVFMNADFEILGFGVIVDGQAALGTTTRGSRYNSANTYVHSCKEAFALVVSEDRSLDALCWEDHLSVDQRKILPEMQYEKQYEKKQ